MSQPHVIHCQTKRDHEEVLKYCQTRYTPDGAIILIPNGVAYVDRGEIIMLDGESDVFRKRKDSDITLYELDWPERFDVKVRSYFLPDCNARVKVSELDNALVREVWADVEQPYTWEKVDNGLICYKRKV